VALSLSSRRDVDTVTVLVAGELDLSTAEQLEDEVAALVAGDATRTILLDFAGVTFIDSAGINTLLAGRRLADGQDRRYRIVGAGGLVRDLLEMTGVWSHLTGQDR